MYAYSSGPLQRAAIHGARGPSVRAQSADLHVETPSRTGRLLPPKCMPRWPQPSQTPPDAIGESSSPCVSDLRCLHGAVIIDTCVSWSSAIWISSTRTTACTNRCRSFHAEATRCTTTGGANLVLGSWMRCGPTRGLGFVAFEPFAERFFELRATARSTSGRRMERARECRRLA
jgi:hypothetical protein